MSLWICMAVIAGTFTSGYFLGRIHEQQWQRLLRQQGGAL